MFREWNAYKYLIVSAKSKLNPIRGANELSKPWNGTKRNERGFKIDNEYRTRWTKFYHFSTTVTKIFWNLSRKRDFRSLKFKYCIAFHSELGFVLICVEFLIDFLKKEEFLSQFFARWWTNQTIVFKIQNERANETKKTTFKRRFFVCGCTSALICTKLRPGLALNFRKI